MNKEIRVLSAIAIVFFLLSWGCASKKAPAEPQMTVPTDTPTPNLTPIDVSARVTKTCFNVDTCSGPGSATSAVAEDKNGYIWASEMSGCAFFKKYTTLGTELYSEIATIIDGIAVDKTSNWVWYTTNYLSGATQYFIAKESNNFSGSSVGYFSITHAGEAIYHGLAFDGQDLWTLRVGNPVGYHCCKYSTSGVLLEEFDIPYPIDASNYYGITYGEGYLWITSYHNTNAYLYKMDTSGTILNIYLLGTDSFYGIDWVSPNTFWVAMMSEVCRINF